MATWASASRAGPVVVEAVEPPTRFSFRWNHPAGEEPTPTNSLLVEFTLSPEGEHTRLRVTEGALASLDRPDIDKAKYAEEHNHGWGVFLDRLAGARRRAGARSTDDADRARRRPVGGDRRPLPSSRARSPRPAG